MPFTTSRRSRFRALLAAVLLSTSALAQSSDTKPADSKSQAEIEAEAEAEKAGFGRIPEYELLVPPNTLSVGVRVSGGASVAFSGVGAISNESMPDENLTDKVFRDYNDGYVDVDARRDNNGAPVPDDGKTNAWNFTSLDQVAPDGTGIYMSAFATTSDGTIVHADSGYNPGFDIELSRRIGSGRKLKWGVQLGIGLSDINAKTTGEITASLRKLTDFYSLLGAAAPTAPYTGPQTRTDVVTNPDGSTTSVITDISVLLSNLPTERTDETILSGAEVNGFWQVKGAYFSTRLGPWVEMPLNERMTIRASGGLSAKIVGAFMRYDERFVLPNEAGELTTQNQTDTETWGMVGGFAAVEGQYWLTERSGFFAGATFEAVSGDVELRSGDRAANMNVESNAGVRLGFTTRF